MKRTDARKPESGHAPRSNQPFFDAPSATAFFTSGQSVQRDPFFQRPASASVPLQAKLTVGAVGDQYEQEADRVAATVVDQINRPAGPVGSARSSVQRLRGEEEVQMRRSPDALQRVEQEEELQMKPIAETLQRMGPAEEEELQMKPDWLQRETDPEEEDELQMKAMPDITQRQGMEEDELQMKGAIAPQATTQGGQASPDLESSIQQARGSGHPIAENVRAPLEQAFGADFSGVRVHTDARSNQLNQSIQAKAFTTGQDVFFRQGVYQPGSRGGQELIAHELTHVVQQNRATVQRQWKKAASPFLAIQQMQGRIKTVMPYREVTINAAPRLEVEADLIEARALTPGSPDCYSVPNASDVVQRVRGLPAPTGSRPSSETEQSELSGLFSIFALLPSYVRPLAQGIAAAVMDGRLRMTLAQRDVLLRLLREIISDPIGGPSSLGYSGQSTPLIPLSRILSAVLQTNVSGFLNGHDLLIDPVWFSIHPLDITGLDLGQPSQTSAPLQALDQGEGTAQRRKALLALVEDNKYLFAEFERFLGPRLFDAGLVRLIALEPNPDRLIGVVEIAFAKRPPESMTEIEHLAKVLEATLAKGGTPRQLCLWLRDEPHLQYLRICIERIDDLQYLTPLLQSTKNQLSASRLLAVSTDGAALDEICYRLKPITDAPALLQLVPNAALLAELVKCVPNAAQLQPLLVLGRAPEEILPLLQVAPHSDILPGILCDAIPQAPSLPQLVTICRAIDIADLTLVPQLLGLIPDHALLGRLLQLPACAGQGHLLLSLGTLVQTPAPLEQLLPGVNNPVLLGQLLQLPAINRDGVALAGLVAQIDQPQPLLTLIPKLNDNVLLERLLRLVDKKHTELNALLLKVKKTTELAELLEAIQDPALATTLLGLVKDNATALTDLARKIDDKNKLTVLIPKMAKVKDDPLGVLAKLLDCEPHGAMLEDLLRWVSHPPHLLPLLQLSDKTVDRTIIRQLLEQKRSTDAIERLLTTTLTQKHDLAELPALTKKWSKVNLLPLIDQMDAGNGDTLTVLDQLLSKVKDATKLEALLKNTHAGERSALLPYLSDSIDVMLLVRVFKHITTGREAIPELLKVKPVKALDACLNFEANGVALLAMINTYTVGKLANLLSKNVRGEQLRELVALEPATDKLFPIVQKVKHTDQVKRLLQQVVDRAVLNDLVTQESDGAILLELLALVPIPTDVQLLFAECSDHALLKALLTLVPENGGRTLLTLLSPIGITGARFSPGLLQSLIEPLLDDGLTVTQVFDLFTALSDDGQNANAIATQIQDMRGTLYVKKGPTDTAPSARDITDVPTRTGADILADTPATPPGKKVLSGPEMHALLTNAQGATVPRTASTLAANYPTGQVIAMRTDNQLWEDADPTSGPLPDINILTNPPETLAQQLTRSKQALQALEKRYPAAKERIQKIYAYNHGQTPRPIFDPAVEDKLGNGVAHIRHRHVLGTGSGIDTNAHVQQRASGNWVNNGGDGVPPHAPIAGAFANDGAAQTAIQAGMTLWCTPVRWRTMRSEIVTGAGLTQPPPSLNVPCAGYVAEDTAGGLVEHLNPGHLHIVTVGDNVDGGFFIQSAWPLP